jgi:hypothetical protein
MGTWKKSIHCEDRNSFNHVTRIRTKFHKILCDICQDHYLHQNKKRVVLKKLQTFDKWPLPEYWMVNMPDKPDVDMLVKFSDGSETLVD